MQTYHQRIKPYWALEISAAAKAESVGDLQAAFRHLERAHVLGQNATWLHTQTHILMLFWGVRRRSGREVIGQILRIFGAATKTIFGLIPEGNTGGSNVRPFQKMSIPSDLQTIINASR